MIKQKLVGLVDSFPNVFCFGLAGYRDELIYASIVSSVTAGQAIFAQVQTGKPLSVNVDLSSETEFPGDKVRTVSVIRNKSFYGKNGEFMKFVAKIPSINMIHMIILHKACEPEKHKLQNRSFHYMLNVDPKNTENILSQRIRDVVTIPVFQEWNKFIAKNGMNLRGIQKAECYGGIQAFAVSTSSHDWEDIISKGLEKELITLGEPH